MQTSATPAEAPVQASPAVPPIPPIPAITIQGGSGGRVVIAQSGPVTAGVPQTSAELAALKARRKEISDQLENVAARRKSLANQIENAHVEAVRDGMIARLKVMDARIVSLEGDLAETGRLLQLAPAQAFASTSTGADGRIIKEPMGEDAVIAVSSVVTIFVLMPLAITACRIWWRRATGTIPARQHKAESDRMDRLESAVETIAIEMERVSEGQRFMTRLLTEGRGEVPVFGAAARGEALRVPANGIPARGEPGA